MEVNPSISVYDSLTDFLLQFVRAKGGIKPHGKPRWIPRAPSKVFNVVPKSHIPDAEINQILRLKYAHADKMAAVTQLLWEDYLLNSDVGEAAKLSAQREEEEHRRLLALNHETNRYTYSIHRLELCLYA